MAEAMISPLITSSVQSPTAISIFDVSTNVTNHILSLYPNITIAQSIPDCITDADLIVMAVKPQNLPKVYAEIKNTDANAVRKDATLLSIVAGKSISNFVSGSGIEKVARSMPNTPAQIGKGVTVWSCTDNITVEEREKIKKVLNAFGKSIFVDDESFIDMSTSISGSGPAYIFLLMEAMIDAGVHMGFSRDTATTLVHQTLLGSTLYAIETGEHPAILRNSVTSPAGTTASAIYELENGRFRTVIKDAIWACYRRSLEMGGHNSNIGPGRVATAQHLQQQQPFTTPLPTTASAAATAKSTPNADGHHPVEAPCGEMNDGNGK